MCRQLGVAGVRVGVVGVLGDDVGEQGVRLRLLGGLLLGKRLLFGSADRVGLAVLLVDAGVLRRVVIGVVVQDGLVVRVLELDIVVEDVSAQVSAGRCSVVFGVGHVGGRRDNDGLVVRPTGEMQTAEVAHVCHDTSDNQKDQDNPSSEADGPAAVAASTGTSVVPVARHASAPSGSK